MQDHDYTVLLTDEDGGEIECEVLDIIEYAGESYNVLIPVDDDSSEPEVVILRENESGELVGFDEVEILDAVFEIFRKNNGLDQ